jgi:hypothetical protein
MYAGFWWENLEHETRLENQGIVKVKFNLEQAMKAQ